MQWTHELNGVVFGVTEHALGRMLEMKMHPNCIRAVLNEPARKHGSNKYPDTECWVRGDYAFAVKDLGDKVIVITALYSSNDAWHWAFERGLSGLKREEREFFAKAKK